MNTLTILIGTRTYDLAHGTHELGGTRYLIDSKGIVAQDKINYSTRNIYTHGAISGLTDEEKILHEIEVKGVARALVG